MSVSSRVIPANAYRRARCTDGCGWSRRILRWPDADAGTAANDWDWCLSIAEIERDPVFPAVPGIERVLVLLQGQGARLARADGQEALLTFPGQRHRFTGERVLTGALIDGPIHVLDLRWRGDRVGADLLVRPLVGSMLFFAAPGETWAVYLMAGQGRFDGSTGLPPLWQGDTALLVGGATRARFMLEGAGQVLAVRLTPPPVQGVSSIPGHIA